MYRKNKIILWENNEFSIITPKIPHISLKEGRHVVIFTKKDLHAPWENIGLSMRAFKLASEVAKIMMDAGLIQWANIQYNSNWGLLPGHTPQFHLHIYGRRRLSRSWGRPVRLPSLPGTFHFPPMPLQEIKLMRKKLKTLL